MIYKLVSVDTLYFFELAFLPPWKSNMYEFLFKNEISEELNEHHEEDSHNYLK